MPATPDENARGIMRAYSRRNEAARWRERPAPPSIVWLLVDSIRRYPGGDFRGKLPFMERFAREAVEFETMVTTAPSTIMSITAMMTGLPAYFLARNYDQFRFDGARWPSLPRVLKDYGYSSWAFLRGPETREKFGTFLDPVPRRLWPSDLRHGEKWRNADLNRLLGRVLEGDITRPAFLFFHFNPKTSAETDPQVSEKVETAYRTLRRAGFGDDDTIWVVCSDHGYPDPRTGISSEWEQKTRLSHDLVLTDDNILIPCAIRYPGCLPRKVEAPVSSLDLFPTLMELAGVPGWQEVAREIDGRSLVPLMEGEEGSDTGLRYFRCDARLMLQTGRATALRSRDFKYIRYHDDHRLPAAGPSADGAEVLIDLRADPEEERNLLAESDLDSGLLAVLERHRAQFEHSEQRGVEFQVRHLLSRQADILPGALRAREDLGRLTVLAAFEPDTAGYAEIGVRALARMLPDARVDVLADAGGSASVASLPGVREVFRYDPDGDGLDDFSRGRGTSGGYDLSLAFVQDPNAPSAGDLLQATRRIGVGKRLLVDCNFNVHRPERYWYYRFRAFMARAAHLSREPRSLLAQGRTVATVLKRHLLRALGRWERWERAGVAKTEE